MVELSEGKKEEKNGSKLKVVGKVFGCRGCLEKSFTDRILSRGANSEEIDLNRTQRISYSETTIT